MPREKHIYGLGRRKTAIARVRLVSGAGDQKINDRALDDYFPTSAMRQAALAPLVLTSPSPSRRD
jgi:small subunit ribosomal protein S9